MTAFGWDMTNASMMDAFKVTVGKNGTVRRLDVAGLLAWSWRSSKPNLELNRKPDEMRDVEVTLDFTPNALASVLYRQGNTVVLACCTKGGKAATVVPS